MSRSPLKQLTIQNLRGSVTPFSVQFERGKKLTIVYGENGSGKSTVCDALDFIGNGRVGSLEGRGLGTVSRFWPSVGMAHGDILVKLETADGACEAHCPRSSAVVAQPEDMQPRVKVLRRSQILKLIEDAPAHRYAAVKPFVDVSEAENSESALRDLIRALKSSRDLAVARVGENQENITTFWESAGSPGSGPMEWAAVEVARDPMSQDADLKALGKIQAAFAALATFPARVAPLQKDLAALRRKVEAEQKAVSDCLGEIGQDAADILSLLQAAHPYLAAHRDTEQCPLCGSGENADGLVGSVEIRIASFAKLQTAQNALSETTRQIARLEAQLTALESDSLQNAAGFQSTIEAHEWTPEIKLPAEAAPTDATALESWIGRASTLTAGWKSAEGERQGKKQFLSALIGAVKTLRENTARQHELDRLIPRLERSLAIVEGERRRFTDAILARIAGEVGRLYEEVHPGEGLNRISLLLDPNQRASLKIGAAFNGQDGSPPQAYFSESHLDTLGLCIFLAMAGLEPTEETILVLDDVLASVDEPHVERVIEMLYVETPRFRHCVITTHYRPWRQKYRWGWLQNGECQFVELRRWQADEGIKMIRSMTDVAVLHALLATDPPDPQLICAKAGVVLEAVLDFLTGLYECSVPRRPDNNYTLGDLLPAIDKKLRPALCVEVRTGENETGHPVFTEIRFAPIIEELQRISQLRNVFGCHFNRISFDLLEGDAVRFGELVAELVSALTDPDEGWPRNGKSGSYWATRGETRRLHPLRKPA